jgi:hypothetical protein
MSANPQMTPSHFLLGEAYKQINCEAADPTHKSLEDALG